MLDIIKFVVVLAVISAFTRGVQSAPSGPVSNTLYSDQTAAVYSSTQYREDTRRGNIVDASHLRNQGNSNNSICNQILTASFTSDSERSDAYNNCLAN